MVLKSIFSRSIRSTARPLALRTTFVPVVPTSRTYCRAISTAFCSPGNQSMMLPSNWRSVASFSDAFCPSAFIPPPSAETVTSRVNGISLPSILVLPL